MMKNQTRDQLIPVCQPKAFISKQLLGDHQAHDLTHYDAISASVFLPTTILSFNKAGKAVDTATREKYILSTKSLCN